jgi:hypothetical protein
MHTLPISKIGEENKKISKILFKVSKNSWEWDNRGEKLQNYDCIGN